MSLPGHTQGQIKVQITGLRNQKGLIRIALYNSVNNFPKAGKQYQSKVIPASTAECIFVDLTPGTYAIALLHDENSNNDPDKNFLGIPREGFAFSRNIEPKFKAPSFKETSVVLKNKKLLKLKIKMCYR